MTDMLPAFAWLAALFAIGAIMWAVGQRRKSRAEYMAYLHKDDKEIVELKKRILAGADDAPIVSRKVDRTASLPPELIAAMQEYFDKRNSDAK
jgi:hypothetical protein